MFFYFFLSFKLCHRCFSFSPRFRRRTNPILGDNRFARQSSKICGYIPRHARAERDNGSPPAGMRLLPAYFLRSRAYSYEADRHSVPCTLLTGRTGSRSEYARLCRYADAKNVHAKNDFANVHFY